jgi:hypothetical protein
MDLKYLKTLKGLKIIYKITNPTGRVYIGQTKNIFSRYTQYKYHSVKTQPAIQNSLLKHGFSNHLFELLFISDCCSDLELSTKECFYMTKFNSLHPKGLNCLNDLQNTTKKNRNFIYCYNKEGKFIKKFESVKHASVELNIPNYSISKVKNKTEKHTHGYRFSEYFLPKISKIKPVVKKGCKQVYKYSPEGNFLEVYYSIAQAHKSVGGNGNSYTNLILSIDKNSISYGFIWKSTFQGLKIKPFTGRMYLKILVKNIITNEIIIFKSLRKASKFLNVSVQTLNNKIKSDQLLFNKYKIIKKKMVDRCKYCKDITYCESIIGHCELEEEAGIERLEDERQSEEFYKSLAEE